MSINNNFTIVQKKKKTQLFIPLFSHLHNSVNFDALVTGCYNIYVIIAK